MARSIERCLGYCRDVLTVAMDVTIANSDIDSGYAPFRWRSVSQVSKLEFGHGALLAVGLVPRPSTLRVWASARAGVRLT